MNWWSSDPVTGEESWLSVLAGLIVLGLIVWGLLVLVGVML